MSCHRIPHRANRPRPISARELREQAYFRKVNLEKIAAIDAYILECEKQGGVTILEVARKHHER